MIKIIHPSNLDVCTRHFCPLHSCHIHSARRDESPAASSAEQFGSYLSCKKAVTSAEVSTVCEGSAHPTSHLDMTQCPQAACYRPRCPWGAVGISALTLVPQNHPNSCPELLSLLGGICASTGPQFVSTWHADTLFVLPLAYWWKTSPITPLKGEEEKDCRAACSPAHRVTATKGYLRQPPFISLALEVAAFHTASSLYICKKAGWGLFIRACSDRTRKWL